MHTPFDDGIFWFVSSSSPCAFAFVSPSSKKKEKNLREREKCGTWPRQSLFLCKPSRVFFSFLWVHRNT